MINEKKCRRYCYEDLSMIENFYMAVSSPERWDCHHRVETIMNCGQKELKAKGCYYHRPAHELIFLSHSEHTKLHSLGRRLSEKTKEKLHEVRLGKRHSEKTKEKLHEVRLGKRLSEETKKKMSRSLLEKFWWNDGEKCIRSKEAPGEGWKRGRLRTGG